MGSTLPTRAPVKSFPFFPWQAAQKL